MILRRPGRQRRKLFFSNVTISVLGASADVESMKKSLHEQQGPLRSVGQGQPGWHEDNGCNIQTNTKLGCLPNQHTSQNISPSWNTPSIHLFSFCLSYQMAYLMELRSGCADNVSPCILLRCITNSNQSILKSLLEQLSLEVALD